MPTPLPKTRLHVHPRNPRPGPRDPQLAAVSVDGRNFTITKIPVEGERQELSLPVLDDNGPTSYWLPRSVFQQLLYSEV